MSNTKKAILTGASGFIGSWLALELLANGYTVTVIARNKERLLPEILQNCFMVEKSLQNIDKTDFDNIHYCTQTTDNTEGVNVFFHLAWEGVTSEKKNSMDIQLENVKIAINALNLSHEMGCKTFIATGTVAEYALCDNVMDMNARQTPNDYYGAAKVSAHYFTEVRARQLEQPFIWCVVPSTFGERRSDSNIITYTIQTLLKGEKPSYGSLEQMWDFLYVQDVAKALRLIGEKGKSGKVYGIGSGEYKTLRDYIYRIRDIINPDLPLGIGDIKAQTTFSSCVNNYDLKKDTGFQPEYSFEEGIIRAIKYYKKQLE